MERKYWKNTALFLTAAIVATTAPGYSVLGAEDIRAKGSSYATPSGASQPDGGGQEELKQPEDRNMTSKINKKGFARDGVAPVTVTIDGAASNTVTFYMKRDPATNKAELPPPVHVVVTRSAGEFISEVALEITPTLSGKIRLSKETIPLDSGGQGEFDVSFIDQAVADGTAGANNAADNYIKILNNEGGAELAKIRVLYGADGLYMMYAGESPGSYQGTLVEGEHRSVGTVDLNSSSAPSMTIYYKHHSYEGADPVTLDRVLLNPNGSFTFADGSAEMLNPGATADGWIAIPIKMKQEIFSGLKRDAAGDGIPISDYPVLTDLAFEYSDGYLTGGKANPLPLVYFVSYTHESGGSPEGGGGSPEGGGGSPEGGGGSPEGGGGSPEGGGGSPEGGGGSPEGGGGSTGGGGGSTGGGGGSTGGGGGSTGGGGGSTGGSGGSSSGTVIGPLETVRTMYSTAGDKGWTQKEGGWYYLDAKSNPVSGWLMAPDGKWYLLGENGIMKTGWVQVSSIWYFLNADGSMATGWVQGADGKWYYLLESGAMAVNTTTPDGYQVGPDGAWK